jgi:hypothetical protein
VLQGGREEERGRTRRRETQGGRRRRINKGEREKEGRRKGEGRTDLLHAIEPVRIVLQKRTEGIGV